MPNPHEAMDAETVADLLGVSTRQIRTYVSQAGMPSKLEGRARTFVWAQVLEWYVGYRAALEGGERPLAEDDSDADEPSNEGAKGEDIRAATLRKTRAEANLKELDLSRRRAEVITIADAKVRLDRMLGNLRARLLGMAPKLASRLEGVKERTEREGAIKEEMEALCSEIATGAIVDLPPDNGGEILSTVPVIHATSVPEISGVSNLDILRNLAELLEQYDPFE